MTLGSQSIEVLDRPETSASVSRPPIDDQRIARAIKLIDVSEICARVDKWRAEDRERASKGPGGRPASLDDRMVLVIMLALVLEGSPLLITHAATAVKYRLSEQAKAMLGIDPDKTGNIDWYDRYWRAFHIFMKVIDLFPGPRNRLLTMDEWAVVLASRDPIESARKQKRLDWVANQFLEASIQMLPRAVRRKLKGNVCIDATLVPAFGKRGTTKGPL